MSENTARSEGIYTLNGQRFRIAAGDPLPEGAEFEELTGEDAALVELEQARDEIGVPPEQAEGAGAGTQAGGASEERAKGAAPENKAKASAPETKSV